MEISPEKSETIAFLRQDPVRCKIVVGNKCLQKVNISYENEKDIQQKQPNFLKCWEF